MGNGGSIKKNLNKFTNSFYVMNADSYCDFDFIKFQNLDINNSLGKIVLTKNHNYHDNKKLSQLCIGKDQKVQISNSKNNLMNAGIYFLKKKCFNQKIKNINYFSLEDEILLPLIKKKHILGFRDRNFF